MALRKKSKTILMGKPQTLREKFLSAPDSPGVYLMRDSQAQVLYVGKANSLRKRLASYLPGLSAGAGTRLCAVPGLSAKTMALLDKVIDVEFRQSPNEAMALLLESRLIHELKPRYNISLRDDKSFPFIRISSGEFPSICITRKKEDTGGQYFGPYTNTKLLKNALKIIRCSFAYRSCKRLPNKSCIYHKINLCPAPCIGKINHREYNRLIAGIVLILEGRENLLISELIKSMQDKSRALDFEGAARKRDQIIALSEMFGKPSSANRRRELEDLKNRLGLEKRPMRIEGFDISNISGKQAVGSMVSFYAGAADKNNYRRFRIKSFQGIDDYKMLAEVVSRRYTRLVKEKAALPDLVLIDGGRGHLLAAAKQLKELNLVIPLVSIAKENENVYSSQKIGKPDFQDTPAINLIRRVRDEAHRFALGYHHLLRRKELISK
jgi:excinuclease ABC subunit C